jgi:hypothetical protein
MGDGRWKWENGSGKMEVGKWKWEEGSLKNKRKLD